MRALPALLRNYSSSVHSVARRAPGELHRADLDERSRAEAHPAQGGGPVGLGSAGKGRQYVRPEPEVGDTVRISTVTGAGVRKEAMLGTHKRYPQQWSTELYTVASKSAPADHRERAQSGTHSRTKRPVEI